jgi:LysM repeat protein
MRPLRISVLAAFAALLAAPAANAHVLHTVGSGESLWWVAAQNNLTTRTLAAYNGLAPDAHVVLGSTLKVPTVAEGAAALAGAGLAPAAAPASDATATSAPVAAATGAATVYAPPAAAPRPLGAYVVRPGDTLSALAAQTGVTVNQMAYANGLRPAATLLVGTVLKLPNGAPAPIQASEPAPAVRIVPDAAPAPTPGRLSAERVGQLAAEHGAPASLAAAIAWQESGFNNAMVSPANARGVMQVIPGTWDWVQRNLATTPLNPTSAEDNVRAGSLYLARLLRETNGDVRLAAAGYYQGLSSVRSRGMFDDTKRYVDDVIALRARFGG